MLSHFLLIERGNFGLVSMRVEDQIEILNHIVNLAEGNRLNARKSMDTVTEARQE